MAQDPTDSSTEPPGETAVRPPHDLAVFMRQDAAEMQSEYDRIRATSREDPGTAGDQGEENWAQLLRKWLPESYAVRVKGRLLAASGARSRQVDLIVLRPGYPRRLLDKKLYLLDGVAAVFECKNTLKAEHLARSFDRVRVINDLAPRTGTPFAETVPAVFCGVLAHSCVWQSANSKRLQRVDALLQKGLGTAARIKDCPSPSLVCVADLACWSAHRMTYDGPAMMPEHIWDIRRHRHGLPEDGASEVLYMRYREDSPNRLSQPPNSISVAIATILGRLARDDSAVRPLTQYFIFGWSNGWRNERGRSCLPAEPIHA